MSAEYRIFETTPFLKDLKLASPDIAGKLRDFVYPQLRLKPDFGPNIKRLKNWGPPTWRYRIGKWRFFYEISHDRRIVFMITADQRKEAYR